MFFPATQPLQTHHYLCGNISTPTQNLGHVTSTCPFRIKQIRMEGDQQRVHNKDQPTLEVPAIPGALQLDQRRSSTPDPDVPTNP